MPIGEKEKWINKSNDKKEEAESYPTSVLNSKS